MNVLQNMLQQARSLIHANDLPQSVGSRHGLRGCTETAHQADPTIQMCGLSKGHSGDHLPSVRPVRGARI